MRRRIEFEFTDHAGLTAKAQAVVDGDSVSLNRLFVLLANHPKIKRVDQHELAEPTPEEKWRLDGELSSWPPGRRQ